jgi:uncharacterized Zn-binding protein involved in type VI secretion
MILSIAQGLLDAPLSRGMTPLGMTLESQHQSRLNAAMGFSMQTLKLSLAMPLALCCGLGVVAAQPAGVVTQGSPDTIIGGKPAARVGDGTASGGPVVEGSRDVFINGRPAAIAGGRNGCGGVVVGGASNVFINGRPAAQAGSQTSDCKGR